MIPLRCTVFVAALAAATALPAMAATPTVIDDTGHKIALAAPARRIVSLAPHATELLFAAGAGSRIVAVGEFSNYPPQARRLPTIGSAAALDLERIIALKPDLAVAWDSGNSAAQIARLKEFGIPVFASEPGDIDAIAGNIERLAQLAGTEQAGRAAARTFRQRLAGLTARYAERPQVSVFYQIWDKPLMTLNDKHMASAVLRLCGGRNIFGSLKQIAAPVGAESVVQANPEVIIGLGKDGDSMLYSWKRFSGMTAVARGNLFVADPDLLTRPGPRIIDGAEEICRLLDTARARRPTSR